MELRTLRRYSLRQLQLPEEYQQKLYLVKRRIASITGKGPTAEETIMCMIDEFLNLHIGTDSERELVEEEDGCLRSIGIENSNSTVLL